MPANLRHRRGVQLTCSKRTTMIQNHPSRSCTNREALREYGSVPYTVHGVTLTDQHVLSWHRHGTDMPHRDTNPHNVGRSN